MTLTYILLMYCAPFVALYICFPWYAAVNRAHREETLSNVDYIVQGIPFICMGILDVFCNILASPLFVDLPFIRGDLTLSERCIYWYHNPQCTWQWGCAHAVKVLTDKYERGHIS